MERFRWHIRAAVRERTALEAVREEVHAEIAQGGKRFSERQRQLTSWQQGDMVPAASALISGCSAIWGIRHYGLIKRGPRLLVLLPALPFYVLPYQILYHVRETEYLVEMMREHATSKFARKLRRAFEAAADVRDSQIVEELESGTDIAERQGPA